MRDVVRKPLGSPDHCQHRRLRRLTDLPNASLQRQPAVAQELLDEMERAKVVDASAVPTDVVRMGFDREPSRPTTARRVP